jgi:hypothetical protein
MLEQLRDSGAGTRLLLEGKSGSFDASKPAVAHRSLLRRLWRCGFGARRKERQRRSAVATCGRARGRRSAFSECTTSQVCSHGGKDAAAAAPTVPDQYKLTMLIRSIVIAVNQANKTGNYSVLRDLGSPNFQSANSVAKLTEIFSGQRNANLDLLPVMFFNPKLIREPAIDENGMLRLTGFFATKPQQVNFDLAFEFVQGEWRHFGVAVSTRPAAALNVTSKAPAQAAPTSK